METRDYQYYSKKLNKVFNTVKELKDAEGAWDEAHKAEEEKAKERKARAEKVNKAYEKYCATQKEAERAIKEAYASYKEELNKFLKDYGSYHYSITDTSGIDALCNSVLDFMNFIKW